ncbi:MAG: NUDIX domain-containing protein, partial [Burkholderiales bacterium]
LGPSELRKLMVAMKGTPSETRARAAALAAVRETFEEAGLIIGAPLPAALTPKAQGWQAFFAHGFQPALARLRFLARAVTPPGRPRRFNARFFMARAEDATGAIRHSSELGDIRWVKLDEARELPLPTITGLILGEIGRLVKEPPNRKRQRKIPLFTTVHRKHLMLEE